MKLLHTADWQMGMRAESVGGKAEWYGRIPI